MKKLRQVDVFGYPGEELEEWWKGSIKKMLRRMQKREFEREMTAPRRSSRKLSRQPPRVMERTG